MATQGPSNGILVLKFLGTHYSYSNTFDYSSTRTVLEFFEGLVLERLATLILVGWNLECWENPYRYIYNSCKAQMPYRLYVFKTVP